MFSRLDKLKNKFDDLDKLTILINKRQGLLGIAKTEFRDQKKILDDLKPLYDLWGVANNFKTLIVEWFEDPLENLDSAIMENQIEGWMIDIKRLSKCSILVDNEKQNEMMNFILDCLGFLKMYQILIKITRVKGLTARHWRQINLELGITIDPATTTLLRMIGL